MNHLKRTFLAPLLLLSIASVPLPAQDSPGPGPDGHRFPSAFLIEFLMLTDEQVAQIEQLASDLQAAVEPLREERRGLREELREELNVEEPDAFVVGGLAIAVHELGELIRSARSEFRAAFEAVLTAEQLEALRELKDKRGGRRHRRGGR